MDTQQQSPFWRFSLALYSQKGVPPACLALQDTSGVEVVDVNVMLYGLWLAWQGRVVDAAAMASVDAAVRKWRSEVVVPLRGVRRVLKEPDRAFATPETQALRDAIKAVELEAERLQQEALYRLRPAAQWGQAEPDRKQAAAANLAAYASALGARFDDSAQSAMLAGLEALAASGKLQDKNG
ncbi:MAG: TIGR02444 family protein [Hyphomicrobiales bacterium]|nr:TIGR02444 family protein [Hyphomicrobiales bacterium]